MIPLNETPFFRLKAIAALLATLLVGTLVASASGAWTTSTSPPPMDVRYAFEAGEWTAPRGAFAKTVFTIANAGPEAVALDLAVSGSGDVAFSTDAPSPLHLAPGESRQVALVATTSPDTLPGEHVARLDARDRWSGVTATTWTTLVVTPRETPEPTTLHFGMNGDHRETRPGGAVAFEGAVANGGARPIGVRLAAEEPSGYLRVEITPAFARLAPGEERRVTARVHVSPEAPAGLYETRLTATPDGGASASWTLTVRVDGPARPEPVTPCPARAAEVRDRTPGMLHPLCPARPEPVMPCPATPVRDGETTPGTLYPLCPARPQPTHPVFGHPTERGFRVFVPLAEGHFELPMLIRGHVEGGMLVLDVELGAHPLQGAPAEARVVAVAPAEG